MGLQGNIHPGPPVDFDEIDLSATDATPNTAKGHFWRGFSFAADGDIKVDTASSVGKTLSAGKLSPLIQHGLVIKKIYKVGTTATGIVAYY